jgi:CelD/BcsL family acetyltransferase involved in cellulose biosynthesis
LVNPEPRVEVVEDERALTALGPAWLRLAAAVARTPFQTYQWNRTWWALVGARDPALRLHVLVLRRAGVVCAIAPLMVRTTGDASELCFLSDPYADYGDLLVDPDRARPDEVARWVLDYGAAGIAHGRWQRLVFAEMPTWQGFAAALGQVAPAADRCEASPCYRLDLSDEDGMDNVWDRGQYHYRQRRLERVGEVACHLHTDAATIADRIPDLMALHLRQWADRPDRGITFDRTDIIRFYHDICGPLGNAGLLLLGELSVAGRAIAYHLGFLHQDVFWAYRTTYDLAMRRYSPGHLLNRSLACRLRDEGFATVDLMRGYVPYKADYATQVATNVTVTCEKTGAPVV